MQENKKRKGKGLKITKAREYGSNDSACPLTIDHEVWWGVILFPVFENQNPEENVDTSQRADNETEKDAEPSKILPRVNREEG